MIARFAVSARRPPLSSERHDEDVRYSHATKRDASQLAPGPPCTSGGSNGAPRASIQSSLTSCEPCGGFSASRSPSRSSCSRQSVEHRSPPPDLSERSSEQRSRQSSDSRAIHTCSGTPVAMRWQTEATIPGPCRRILDTKTFSTRFAILNYHRIGSKISGGNEP
jgi:hypothetical protein